MEAALLMLIFAFKASEVPMLVAQRIFVQVWNATPDVPAESIEAMTRKTQ